MAKETHYCVVCGLQVKQKNIGPHTFNEQPCNGPFEEIVRQSMYDPHTFQRQVLEYLVSNGPSTVKQIAEYFNKPLGNVVNTVFTISGWKHWVEVTPTGRIGAKTIVEITEKGRNALGQ